MTKKNLLFLLISLSTLEWSGELLAAEEDLSLADLLSLKVDVSSSNPETIFNTPSSVSVIDRKTIKKLHFRSVSEAIKTLAGVDVSRTFFAQNIPSIRGILQDNYVNRLLVLIDGVPTWNSVTGHGEIERVNINDLERIEVLKGPASVLYGTNAYSGAINLVLRRPEKEGEKETLREFRTGAGFLSGLLGAGGHVMHSEGNVQFFVAGSSETQSGSKYPGKNNKGEEGYFRDENGDYLFFKDFQEKSNLTGKVNYDASYGKHSLFINTYRNNLSFLGARPIRSQGAGNPYEVFGKMANYSFQRPIGDSSLKVSLVYDSNSREFSRKEDNRVKGRLQGDRMLSRTQWNLNITPSLDLETGFDIEKRTSQRFELFDPLDQKVFQDNEMSGRSISERSGFVQMGFHGEKTESKWPFRLLFGARLTKNDAYDQNTSFRGTFVYNIAEKSSLKLVYGQSYRAPSLFELYYKDSAATNEIFGNDQLEPESSDSFELAYLLAPTDSLFFQVTYFAAEYDDKITRVLRNPDIASDLSLTFANSEKFKAQGIELEAKYQNPNVIDAFWTISSIKGDEGDKVGDKWNYRFVPEVSSSLSLSKGIEVWSVSATANYRGERGSPTDKISPMGTLDSALAYRSAFGSHSVQVKNATDAKVAVPEYIRGDIDSLYSGERREVIYEFATSF
ncbi:TonB-dependent receptor plug domain-containing protein [Oligoflexus tunisiensis]|uniref:TonB-dependent receptor plug domain-containing protein n=1 Tax=Oligoflexus tunisiensis TaxID=708132 RepID=UPI000A3E4A6B|nr:TonB-dependent receptor [Oligoflexus tunisiensis]